MLHIGHLFMRYFIAFITVPMVISISMIGFKLGFFISLVISALIFILTLFFIKSNQRYKKRKQFGLSKSEYNHIESQLNEAIEFLQQFNRTYTKIRSISGFKNLYEMSKLSKRIISIVRTNPPKFYQAEIFFYSHLPSAAEITEKYAFLSQQPIKDTEVHISLQRTREALNDVFQSMEKDLRQLLATDIEELKIELDIVKQSTRRSANTKEEL